MLIGSGARCEKVRVREIEIEVGKKWSADLLPIIKFDVTTSGQKGRWAFARYSLAAALQVRCRTSTVEGLTNR